MSSGVSPGAAGFLFAACSVLGLVSRVGFGWLADRHPDRSRYLFIANLLAGGAVGYGLLATGPGALLVVGSLMAYVMGWAWTGLFHFAVIKDNRAAAASVTGFVQTGLSLGAAAGRSSSGSSRRPPPTPRPGLTAGVLSLLAAVTIRISRRMVRGPAACRWPGSGGAHRLEGADIQAPT